MGSTGHFVQLGTSTPFHRKAHLPGSPRAAGCLLLPSSPSGWCGPVPWPGRARNYPKRKTAHLDIIKDAWLEATVSQQQTEEGHRVPTTGYFCGRTGLRRSAAVGLLCTHRLAGDAEAQMLALWSTSLVTGLV